MKTDTAREADDNPVSALEREAEKLIRQTRDPSYRLMLVVSCSISSTVCMTFAFDE